MYYARFEKECDEAVQGLEPKSAALAGKIAALAYKISRRYPFVFLPDFVEDLVNGALTSHIMSKYCIKSSVDYGILVRDTLKLPGTRSKKRGADNRQRNLQNHDWKERYDLLSSQSGVLRKPLEGLLASNILVAAVSHAVIRKRRVPREDLRREAVASYWKIKDKVYVPQFMYRTGVLEGYGDELAQEIIRTARCLESESYITSTGEIIAVHEKYSRMSDVLYKILDGRKDGASYQSLMTSAVRELPLLRFLPGMAGFDSCLAELSAGGSVVHTRPTSHSSPYSSQLFTKKNYESRIERAKNDMLRAGRMKFFGRRMEPDRFISELVDLPPGDLGDEDDQVTRLAGLVLGDSASLQSPPENAMGFDFMVDITQYEFRPEQKALLEKLDFKVNSAIFHCKAMINDTVTADHVRELALSVPKGEQGVVFTCQPVPQTSMYLTRADPTVQIIGREGIRGWCSMVQTIPCRRNSVVRAMYGDGVGKISSVRSLNYESGLATVEEVPGGQETTLPIRCLKEIGPDAPDMEDLDSATDEYLGMLCSLAYAAPESFEDGMGLQVLRVHYTERDMLKSTKPHFDWPALQHETGSTSRRQMYVEFDYAICVRIDMGNRHVPYEFDCTCGHRLNQEHYFTMCKHIVAAVNHLARYGTDQWADQAPKIGRLKASAEWFRGKSVDGAVAAMCDVLDSDAKIMLKQYLMERAGSR